MYKSWPESTSQSHISLASFTFWQPAQQVRSSCMLHESLLLHISAFLFRWSHNQGFCTIVHLSTSLHDSFVIQPVRIQLSLTVLKLNWSLGSEKPYDAIRHVISVPTFGIPVSWGKEALLDPRILETSFLEIFEYLCQDLPTITLGVVHSQFSYRDFHNQESDLLPIPFREQDWNLWAFTIHLDHCMLLQGILKGNLGDLVFKGLFGPGLGCHFLHRGPARSAWNAWNVTTMWQWWICQVQYNGWSTSKLKPETMQNLHLGQLNWIHYPAITLQPEMMWFLDWQPWAQSVRSRKTTVLSSLPTASCASGTGTSAFWETRPPRMPELWQQAELETLNDSFRINILVLIAKSLHSSTNLFGACQVAILSPKASRWPCEGWSSLLMFFSAVPSCPVTRTNVAEILRDCRQSDKNTLKVCVKSGQIWKVSTRPQGLEQVSGCAWSVLWPWPGQTRQTC